jgi:hypothetical protein
MRLDGFIQATGAYAVELASSARVIDGTVGGNLRAGIDIDDNRGQGIGGLARCV